MQRDRFFPPSFDACAPLLLWALHFFVAYVFAAAACLTSLAEAVWLGHPAIWVALLAWSFAALLCALWLLFRARRACRDAHDRLVSGVRMGCAVLALVGIAWTSLPLLMLSVCTA